MCSEDTLKRWSVNDFFSFVANKMSLGSFSVKMLVLFLIVVLISGTKCRSVDGYKYRTHKLVRHHFVQVPNFEKHNEVLLKNHTIVIIDKHKPVVHMSDFNNKDIAVQPDTERRLDDIVDGVYWTSKVQNKLPRGFDKARFKSWKDITSSKTVESMQLGCGRMSNRLVTFSDGTKSCVRYRDNSDQIHGELFSFYLAWLLGIPNIPPLSMGVVGGREWQWEQVANNVTDAGWIKCRPFIFSQFIEGLTPAYIPKELRHQNRSLHPSPELLAKSDEELAELAQFSDLVVFDYLTANVDRIVNNMHNEQWNEFIMSSPAHNLDKIESNDENSGLLIFYDNEPGLLHGYRLLKSYQSYHDALLKSLCLFRPKTAKAIKKFHQNKSVGEELWQLFASHEPDSVSHVRRLPDKNVDILNQRISDVYNQIVKCEQKYS